MTAPHSPAVSVKDLHVTYAGGGKTIRAVNGVSLDVAPGEAVALIGESGSGKSVTLRALMRLHPPRRTRIGGQIHVDGQDVLALDKRALARLRGGTVAMVFQEPLLALDPVYTVGQQIVECIRTHKKVSAAEARALALKALEAVRIPSPERPLDATVQIQVLILLRELQRELGLSIVFVTHDMGAAVEIADRVAVMYGGRIVEEGPIRTLLREARHPYTMALLQSRQHGMDRGQRLQAIGGAPPDLAALPPGCTFAPRCAHARPACLAEAPRSVALGNGHRVSCVLVADSSEPSNTAAASPAAA
jgi:peptide/nickel transport system ATP-binding protein